MTPLEEAIDDLKFFVAIFYDGSISRNFELDELLWQVRLKSDKQLQKHAGKMTSIPEVRAAPLSLTDLLGL